jgi:hypothetical protein
LAVVVVASTIVPGKVAAQVQAIEIGAAGHAIPLSPIDVHPISGLNASLFTGGSSLAPGVGLLPGAAPVASQSAVAPAVAAPVASQPAVAPADASSQPTLPTAEFVQTEPAPAAQLGKGREVPAGLATEIQERVASADYLGAHELLKGFFDGQESHQTATLSEEASVHPANQQTSISVDIKISEDRGIRATADGIIAAIRSGGGRILSHDLSSNGEYYPSGQLQVRFSVEEGVPAARIARALDEAVKAGIYKQDAFYKHKLTILNWTASSETPNKHKSDWETVTARIEVPLTAGALVAVAQAVKDAGGEVPYYQNSFEQHTGIANNNVGEGTSLEIRFVAPAGKTNDILAAINMQSESMPLEWQIQGKGNPSASAMSRVSIDVRKMYAYRNRNGSNDRERMKTVIRQTLEKLLAGGAQIEGFKYSNVTRAPVSVEFDPDQSGVMHISARIPADRVTAVLSEIDDGQHWAAISSNISSTP